MVRTRCVHQKGELANREAGVTEEREVLACGGAGGGG